MPVSLDLGRERSEDQGQKIKARLCHMLSLSSVSLDSIVRPWLKQKQIKKKKPNQIKKTKKHIVLNNKMLAYVLSINRFSTKQHIPI